MHGKRPWDFEQEFQVDGGGIVTPTEFGGFANEAMEARADAVQKHEVSILADAARERHHGQHSGCHECAVWTGRHLGVLSDVPWQYRVTSDDGFTNENTGYPPVRQAFTGHLGEP